MQEIIQYSYSSKSSMQKSGIKETVMLIFFYCNILGVFWPFHDSSNLVCGNLLYIITFMI